MLQQSILDSFFQLDLVVAEVQRKKNKYTKWCSKKGR